jgi:hypothetical protein
MSADRYDGQLNDTVVIIAVPHAGGIARALP